MAALAAAAATAESLLLEAEAALRARSEPERRVAGGTQRACRGIRSPVSAGGRRPAASSLTFVTVSGTKAALECVPFLAKWLNHLCSSEGWIPLTTDSFFEDLRTGLVLCKALERLVPGVVYPQAPYQRPKTKRPCVLNIDFALQATWKQGVNSINMCTADDMYEGRVLPAVRCLVEIFQQVQMRLRDVYGLAQAALGAMQTHLVAAGRPLQEEVLRDPLSAGSKLLLADFADGLRLMAMLVAFGHASALQEKALHAYPHSAAQCRENLESLCRQLTACGCPLLLTPAEWMRPPAPPADTLLYQLYVIWQFLSKGAEKAEAPLSREERVLTNFLGFYQAHFVDSDDFISTLCGQALSEDRSRLGFVRAMTKLGYKGDLRSVWAVMDPEQQGHVSATEVQVLVSQLNSLAGRPAKRRDSSERLGSPQQGGGRASLVPAAAPLGLEHKHVGAAASWARTAAEGATPQLLTLVVGPEQQPANEALQFLITSCEPDGEARLRSNAEERRLLFEEDARRLGELEYMGRITGVRKFRTAATAGAAAASQVVEAPWRPEALEATASNLDVARALEAGLGPTPTPSIEARLVLADHSAVHVWLQTGLVDRVLRNGRPNGEAVLILEAREHAGKGEAAGRLRGQCDVANILAVERLENESNVSALDTGASAGEGARKGDVSYVVAARRGAELPLRHFPPPAAASRPGGAEESGVNAEPSPFHAGLDDSVLLCLVVGPSAWQRREAERFFAELQLLAEFMSVVEVPGDGAPEPKRGDGAESATP